MFRLTLDIFWYNVGAMAEFYKSSSVLESRQDLCDFDWEVVGDGSFY